MPAVLIWDMPASEKVLYLTFDDGPVAGITDKALEILEEYQAKSTFFCVGDNVRKYPETFRKIIQSGHTVGNHTYHHLNGWKTPTEDYLHDIQECAKLVDSRLFRPPYGRISHRQTKIISKAYKIIMWSALSGDFDPKVSTQQCARNVLRYAEAGSIIVMHDGQKSRTTMLTALPLILAHFTQKGFKFLSIGMD